MYLSAASFQEAYNTIKSHKSDKGIDNGFLGFLFIIKSASKIQPVTAHSKLSFSSSDVSRELSECFSFIDVSPVDHLESLLLSEDYIYQIKNKFLHGSRVDGNSIALLCMNNNLFPQELAASDFFDLFTLKFGLTRDQIDEWFDIEEIDSCNISYSSSEVNYRDKIDTIIPEFESGNSLSLDNKNNLVKKKAGDWGSSSYLQKFKPTTAAGDFVAVIHSSLLEEFISTISSSPEVLTPTVSTSSPFHLGFNKIYYGAPGTGKSHKIDAITTPENSVRTVFHPETQHNDFVGCLKPSMKEDDIVYSFRPGPLSLALVKASKNYNEATYLIIEEINRGAAAAIFGDLFLLLDRENGRSRYTIDISDPDMKSYLERYAPNTLDENGKLFIPSNLSLMATMNSSDQAVMPMDSAFKRRWEFEYIPLVSDVYPQGNLFINTLSGKITISWKSFSTIINKILADSQHIPEDRLLGPWFLSEKEMIDEPTANKSLASKVLMYLFDDVLRHGNKSDIFNENGLGNFGTLITAFNGNKPIFDSSLISLFETEQVINVE